MKILITVDNNAMKILRICARTLLSLSVSQYKTCAVTALTFINKYSSFHPNRSIFY